MRRWIRKATFLAGFSLLAALSVFSAPEKATIKQVVDDPASYDQQPIVVEGVITKIKLHLSRAGNSYSTFLLSDDSHNSIKVFLWGHQEIKKQNIMDGDRVEVKGTFQKVKRIGKYRFYNEVEAESVKKLK